MNTFKYFREKITNSKTKNIYHELGHTLFACILEKYFEYGEITTDKKILKNIGDGKWKAAAKISERNPGLTSDQIEFRIHKIIISFAGICTQNILSNKFTNLEKLIPNWINSPDKYMNTYGAGGDMETPEKLFPLISLETEMSYNKFRIKIFELIFFILKEMVVYEGLKTISKAIKNGKEKTISKDKLEKYFTEYGIDKYYSNKRNDYYKLILDTFKYEKW